MSRCEDPPLHALFRKRVNGDDALLELARLRFEQAGLAAEVYAGSTGELEHVLRFVPPGLPPIVHLARDVDLLYEPHRERVAGLVRRAGHRVAAYVVHDRLRMAQHVDEFRAAAEQLAPALRDAGTARLFVEYAAGCLPEEFVAMGAALSGLPQLGLCIDVGHVGIRAARREFARLRPDVDSDLAHIRPGDPRLPDLVDDVDAAVAAAAPTVLRLTEALAAQGTPTHYHLHDGHPLVAGLPDHFGFLGQLPIPFDHAGRRSLRPLYGATGLAGILEATRSFAPGQVSLTLEIHQVEARLPLADATPLFLHWHDLTNAERMNAWLAVLCEHSSLVESLREQHDDAVQTSAPPTGAAK